MSLRDVGTIKDTTVVTLKHPATRKPLPNADGTPMTVTVYGPYSARYKAVIREQQQARMGEAVGDALAPLTPDEIEALSDELMVRCIADWHITLEGDEPLPYSPEAAEQVIAEFPWLRDQINAAMGNVATFLEPSKPH